MCKSQEPQGIANAIRRRTLKMFLRILKIHDLDRLYGQTLSMGSDQNFSQNLLKTMDVEIDLQGHGFKHIPPQGQPLIIISNHPFGGLEAMVLAAALAPFRTDVRFLANALLGSIPEIRDLIIPVDPFGGPAATRTNLHGLKSALNWIKGGGLLCIFPAGEVAHWRFTTKTVNDPPWQLTATKLIRKSGATVLPVFFPGCNSRFFLYAGLIHPRLRTAMLPRELLNKTDRRITMFAEKPIQAETLKQLPSDEVATWYLRARTFALDQRSSKKRNGPKLLPDRIPKTRKVQPMAAPLNRRLINNDIQALPPNQVLIDSDPFVVFEARAGQIPHLLHEIGRLRELTFRREGEGTGRSLDLDLFDQTYEHLILWDSTRQTVAGAYRIGRVDRLLKTRRGVKALYSSTLFQFKPDFFKALPQSLELGRSFIVPEYQREYFPLLLLWKGIGQFIAKRPGYRYLFGPVSISQAYADVSVQSLINHLHSKFYQPELACKVQGKRCPKFKIKQYEWTMIQSLSSLETPVLDAVIADFESNGRRFPVLLKHYLKLGGKIAGFHHDRLFGSFDGLIIVDLLQTDRKLLKRFMGRKETEQYLTELVRTNPAQALSV